MRVADKNPDDYTPIKTPAAVSPSHRRTRRNVGEGISNMIEHHMNAGTGSGFLVLRPNHSMSWAANRLWMTLLSALTIGLALLFALRGLWPILVAATIQLTWLWLLVYKVALDCQRRECVQLNEAEIVVLRGRYRPTQELRFPRCWTRLVVRPGASERHPSRIYLRCYGRETELGQYLREEERQRLADVLRPFLRPFQSSF